MKKQGFTLIELLIVVAIIAILALIAVPNFLEAQVRSRVSRVKEDMRSIATALEAYHVDWTSYPTYHYRTYQYGGDSTREFFLGGEGEFGGSDDANFDGNPQITTPIAFITSVPEDAFHIPEGDDPPDTRSFLYVNWPYAFRNYKNTDPAFCNHVIMMYGTWRTTSAGPDRSRGTKPGDEFDIIYDPTNGTVSPGNIHRTQRSPEGIPTEPLYP